MQVKRLTKVQGVVVTNTSVRSRLLALKNQTLETLDFPVGYGVATVKTKTGK
jgi:hypothetical protein